MPEGLPNTKTDAYQLKGAICSSNNHKAFTWLCFDKELRDGAGEM
jgi:hypothetical protein